MSTALDHRSGGNAILRDRPGRPADQSRVQRRECSLTISINMRIMRKIAISFGEYGVANPGRGRSAS